ncbi:MAG: hypothetical protein KatS3mg006_1124 [Pyrinomonadaceae bacterium]|nr:MAG: hypothetical protein KatS3mg006_1124 [Pyrinomonadaceae bacterium]
MIKSLTVFIFGFVLSTFSFAQTTFKDDNVPYTFEIPEATWRMTVKPSASNPSVEYVYGDRSDGHLEIRKIETSPNELLSEVIEKEKEQKLQFLPGYVAGKEENFSGALSGKVFNFEFVRAGRNMSGRFYFLKADEKTVYVLRFTGERDKLRLIRNQLDIIARTFRVK